jgi:hypothetical protein
MSAPVPDGPTSSNVEEAEEDHPIVMPTAKWEPAQLKKLQMVNLKILLRSRKCVIIAFDKVVLRKNSPRIYRRLWKASMKVADAAACLADALVLKPLTDEEKRIEMVWRKLNLPEPSSLNAEFYHELDAETFECVFSGTDDVDKYLKSRLPLDETESGSGATGGFSSKVMDDMCSDAELAKKTQSQYRRQFVLYLVSRVKAQHLQMHRRSE